MIVLPPHAIRFEEIISSSVADPDVGEPALWSAGSSYISGNLVRRDQTKTIYESLSPTSTVDSTPPEVSVTSTVPKWREVGLLNKYKMFDYTRNQKTSSENSIAFTLQKSERVNTIALVGMENVESIRIELFKDATTHTVYDGPNSYIDPEGATKYYATRVFGNIMPLHLPEILVTLEGPNETTENVSITYAIFGMAEDLGKIQNSVSVDALNFSKVDRDIYGNATLVQRRNVPRINCVTMIEPVQVDRVAQLRSKLNAKPALWLGVDNINDVYYNSLTMLGFYKTFSFALDNPIAVEVSLEIEEL